MAFVIAVVEFCVGVPRSDGRYCREERDGAWWEDTTSPQVLKALSFGIAPKWFLFKDTSEGDSSREELVCDVVCFESSDHEHSVGGGFYWQNTKEKSANLLIWRQFPWEAVLLEAFFVALGWLWGLLSECWLGTGEPWLSVPEHLHQGTVFAI